MVFTKRQLLTLLSVLVLLAGFTYYNRCPTGDDAWFAEQSYWLQKDGVIRSEFFRGTLNWEKQLFVSHKLFLAFGAFLMKLFGFGLPTVQFVGFIFFCALIGELIIYVRQEEKRNSSSNLLLLLILVFSNQLLIRNSFENRPELMVSALGFGSFLCINSERKTLLKSGLAGGLAGLALLSHLNGVIYLVAGFATYMYTRRYKEASLFFLIGSLTASTYFADALFAKDGFSSWYYQFRHDPETQNAFGLYAKLMVMLTFPKLFVESPEQAGLTILLVFMLWHQRALIKQLPLVLKAYSLLVLIAFGLLTKNGSGTYMPLFMPFMFAIIYELYKRKPFVNWGLRLVLLVYFIIGIYGSIEIIHRNLTLGNFPEAYKKLRAYIPQNTNGLVPLTFFFNEYEQYAHLLSHENFTSHSAHSGNPSDEIATWAHQHNVDFILFDYKYRADYFYPEPATKNLPYYKLNFFDGRFAVYLKK